MMPETVTVHVSWSHLSGVNAVVKHWNSWSIREWIVAFSKKCRILPLSLDIFIILVSVVFVNPIPSISSHLSDITRLIQQSISLPSSSLFLMFAAVSIDAYPDQFFWRRNTSSFSVYNPPNCSVSPGKWLNFLSTGACEPSTAINRNGYDGISTRPSKIVTGSPVRDDEMP